MLPFALAGALVVLPQAAEAPLFSTHEPLVLEIEADFPAIRRDSDADPAGRPATVRVAGPEGPATLAAQLEPRGSFRRSGCPFPPLRLDVRGAETEGTPFEGQRRLKMVVPCRSFSTAFEELVRLEYLAYRLYSEVTEESYLVRRARVTFVDVTGEDEASERDAFFIEDDDALALRLGGLVVDIPDGRAVRADRLDAEASTRVAIFQYMIGNPDWSDAEVHNVDLFQIRGRIVPVPYDFDFSGLVDAPYAAPPERLGLRSVRERRYLGWCWPGQEPAEVIAPYQVARTAMERLVESLGSSPSREAEARAYLGDFFEAIETPERAWRMFLRDCRELPRAPAKE